MRLVTAFLIEYSEEWAVGRSCIRSELIERYWVRLGLAACLGVVVASKTKLQTSLDTIQC